MAGAGDPVRRQLVTRLFGPRNRHRQPEGRRHGRTAARTFSPRAVGFAAAALLAVTLVPALLAAAGRHPYFRVDRIELRHVGRTPDGELRAVLAPAERQSIWQVDTAALEARLRAVPWVRQASVRRVFPDRLIVRVREHRPVAILATGEPARGFYYVARDGRIFAPVGTHDGRDLPYLTGLGREELDGRRSFGPRAIRRALGLLRLVERHAPQLGPVSEVHIGRDGDLTLLPTRPAIPIALGPAPDAAMLARVVRVLPQWAGREAELAGLRVFDDQVIVRTRAPRAAGAPGAASGGSG